MSGTRTPHRRAWAVALTVAGALTAGLVTAAPAQAAGDPSFLYIDSPAASARLAIGDSTGAGETGISTGLQVYRFDASADGSVVALTGGTGTATTPYADVTQGLLIATNGVARVLTTYYDTNPVVSADGSFVWFVTDGDLYRYATATDIWQRMTFGGPFFPPTEDHYLSRISVSPGGDRIGAVYRRYDTSDRVDSSQVTISTIEASPATLFTTSYSGATSVEAGIDAPAWLDNDNAIFPRCATGTCATWTWRSVDLTAGTPTDAAFTGPDDLYDLRALGGTWYGWKDTGSGASLSTQLMTSTDGAQSFAASGGPRTDSTSSMLYVPVTAAPSTLSGTKGSAVTANAEGQLLLSTSHVSTGGSAVYLAFAEYLAAIGDQTWPDDAGVVMRGELQYSADRSIWRTLRTTSGATSVAFPGLPFPGNGRTQALTRNTWFRWFYRENAFAGPTVSTVELVTVSPTITAKAKKKGSKRIVSGTVKRIGGKVTLYKGSKKLATASIKGTGAFKFKARKLAKGTYKLKVAADASWAASSKKLKV